MDGGCSIFLSVNCKYRFKTSNIEKPMYWYYSRLVLKETKTKVVHLPKSKWSKYFLFSDSSLTFCLPPSFSHPMTNWRDAAGFARPLTICAACQVRICAKSRFVPNLLPDNSCLLGHFSSKTGFCFAYSCCNATCNCPSGMDAVKETVMFIVQVNHMEVLVTISIVAVCTCLCISAALNYKSKTLKLRECFYFND